MEPQIRGELGQQDEYVDRRLARAVGRDAARQHAFGGWGDPGFICGCDSAGDVVKVGSNVKSIAVGDRVAGFV